MKAPGLIDARKELLLRRLKQSATPIDVPQKAPMVVGQSDGPAPLSYAQERLWIIEQLGDSASAYNVPWLVALTGELSVEALRMAFRTVIDRHSILRTTFERSGDELRQLIAPTLDLALEPEAIESEYALSARVAEENLRTFDLEKGPLLRALLFKLREDSHVLMLTFHHIIFDGWSIGILLNDLIKSYQASKHQTPDSLSQLPVQYADFARWQRGPAVEKLLRSQVAYWKDQLHGVAPLLDLPTDRQRPSAQRYVGSAYPFAIGHVVAESLSQLARSQKVTLFTVLHSAWTVLLARLSGTADIVVGTPVAGRARVELQNLIGLFANTLVLRTPVESELSFAELLTRNAEIILQAFAHQELPFEQLVEELKPTRSLSYSPLFQVMFVLQNMPQDRRQLEGLSFEVLPTPTSTAKFDLTLSMWEERGRLKGSFEYNTDLFDEQTIQRMAQHYEVLLQGICEDPGAKVGQLPLLTAQERRRILVEWNQTQAEYPQGQCVHELFEQQVQRTPQAVAVVFEGQELSYEQLNAQANRLAHRLRSEGVGPDTLVAICVERSLEMVVGLLGILKAGGAYVPLDPSYPQERLSFMLQDAAPKVVLTQHRLQGVVQAAAGTSVIELDGVDGARTAAFSDLNLPVEHTGVRPEHLAYVIYTSGSTGMPKGVAIEHRNTVNFVCWAQRAFDVSELRHTLFSTSLNFDLAVYEVFVPLSVGAAAHVVPNALKPSLGATLINTVPSAVNALLHEEALPKSVRTINVAGEPLRRALVERLFEQTDVQRVCNLYGPTETTTYSTWVSMPREKGFSAHIGRPISNTQVYLLDKWMQPVPIGARGELYIGGDGVARGYHGRPELTLERFLANPFHGGRMYRTGDVGRWLADGSVEYLGRNAKLPLTPNGKIDRAVLPQPDERAVHTREYEAPQGEVEEQLATIWREVLQLPQVGRWDNFFDLGGHSLLATRVMWRLRSIVKVRVQLRELFEHQVLQELAARVQQLHGQGASDWRDASPITPVTRDQALPLSFSQQRLWFLNQFEPQSSFYNMPFGVKAEGALDVHALHASLLEIVRRHEALRTTFQTVGAGPAQVISSEATVPVETSDLSSLEPEQAQQQVAELTRQEASTPFDLAKGPLLRVRIVRTGERAHVVLVTMHHIVSDGWSVGVFLRELTALYEAYVNRQPSPLAPLPVQYADYAVWQQTHMSGQALQQQLDYWTRRLKGAPPLLELPTDRPRPEIQRHRGATLAFTIPTDTATKIQTLNSAANATLFMTLSAALSILLSRYSGQGDICIGMATANRNRLEIEPLIGFFVNTVVLRTRVDGTRTFLELMRQVRESSLEAYAHQDVPFERLVAHINPPRNTSYSPLFQVLLVVQNTPAGEIQLPDLQIKPIFTSPPAAKFDLRLSVTESNRGLNCGLEYDKDIFDEQTIRRMAQHYVMLLQAICEAPHALVQTFSMESEGERRSTWGMWEALQGSFTGNGDKDLRVDLESHTVLDLFRRAVARYPTKHALAGTADALTYKELDGRSNQVCNSLRKLLGPGSVTGIFVSDPILQVVATIGAMKAGCIFASLNVTYPTYRLVAMVTACGPEVIVTDANSEALLETLLNDVGRQVPTVLVECKPANAVNYASTFMRRGTSAESMDSITHVPCGPDDPCYIYFTSGSTGEPKPVLGRTESLAHFVLWEIEALGITSNTRASHLTNPSFHVYLREIFSALSAGATVCIPPPSIFEAQALGMWLESAEITLMHCVPSVFRLLLETDGRHSFSSLQDIVFGGEALLPSDVNRWRAAFGGNARLTSLYGSTEVTLAKFWYRVPSGFVEAPYIPLGKPIPGAQAIVLRPNGEPCRLGEIGEIHIRTPYRSLGYFRRPDLTSKVFIANPRSFAGDDILYKTGDLGMLLPEKGMFRFLGRNDFQVKIRGIRIELGEIEAVLVKQPRVGQAVVVARQDASGDKKLVAYVTAAGVAAQGEEEAAALDLEVLRAALRQQLPEYMVPSAIVTMAKLPLTPNGKIDRAALPQPDERAVHTREYEAPQGEVEEQLAAIWREVLQLPQVGRWDNFFDLGGHSLLATRVMWRLRSIVKVEVQLRELFEYPVLQELAARVQQLHGQGASDWRDASPITPVTRDQALPLSFSQQRLWFLNQFEPQSSFYNMPFGVKAEGALDVHALHASLLEIVRRHEALRTTFQTVGAGPAQVISSEATVPVETSDLSSLEPEQAQQQVAELTRQEASTPFDLAKGPLLRVRIVRTGERAHVVLVTMHHIVSDGWSVGVFLRELTALYEAYVNRQPSPLAPLPVQYADYAVWQQTHMSGQALQQQLDYWTRRLKGAPPLLELPTDRPRPEIQRHRGATLAFTIPTDTATKIQTLNSAANATLFMTLSAALSILLSRYSGQGDICIGMATANRNRLEIEPLIGCFVNTLVLRTVVDSSSSFSELLQQVRKNALEAYAHQDVPFERLVEYIKPQRHTSHSPLFQVLLVVQNTPPSEIRLPDLQIQPLLTTASTAKFDLRLDVTEASGGLACALEYDTDLFDEQTIQRMAQHYEVLLQGICEDPGAKVGQLPLLTAQERRRILVEWNQTQAEYPQGQCVHELFEQQVQRTPQAVAVVFEGQELSYEQLNAQANRLAHRLRSEGVGPDTLVAICVERSLEMVVGLLGILKAGGAYVPLDPSYPQERLSFMLQDAAPKVVLTQHRLQGVVQAAAGTSVIELDGVDGARTAAFSDLNLPVEHTGVRPEHLAYVIYTSGSTGMPKGVMVKHQGVCNLLADMLVRLKPRITDTLLAITTLSFDIAALELYLPLWCGARLVVAGRQTAGDPQLLAAEMRRSGATLMQATPAMWRTLLESGWQGQAGLKALCGGEALRKALSQPLRGRVQELWNVYGPTETTIWSAAHRVDAAGGGSEPIGRALANTQIYLLDAQMQPVPIGAQGEIYVGGAGLARGYLGREELTAQRFVANPFGAQGSKLYKTGDVGRWLADGSVEYLGRNDHQVKVRGFRIELGEIEAVLVKQPRVGQAVVVARQDASGDKKLVAYVTAAGVAAQGEEEAAALDLEVLRAALRQQLPEYMVPSAIVTMAKLPLTPNGKIDRAALPQPDERAVHTREYEAPQGEVEEQLAAIWREVLQLPQVGRWDNFFDLGGHSLLAVRAVAMLDQIGLHVAVRDAITFPTIQALAHHSMVARTLPSSLVPIRTEGDLTPFFLVHPAGGEVAYAGELAKNLPANLPVYGLAASGLGDGEAVFTCIGDMARHYIGAMRTVQPVGPYRLGGWSVGGTIAHEMANQLLAAGDVVELVALIDTYADYSNIFRTEFPDESIIPSMHSAADAVFHWLPAEADDELKAGLRHHASRGAIDEMLLACQRAGMLPPEISLAAMRRHLSVRHGIARGLLDYEPFRIDARVCLFMAERGSQVDVGSRADPTLGWSAIQGGDLEAVHVGGEHRTITRAPHVEKLAAAIAKALGRSTARPDRLRGYSPLVTIDAGLATAGKLFCIPGAGASVSSFIPLAEVLARRMTVHGLQQRGLEGELQPYADVEETSRAFSNSMREAAPQGPYHILGHSYGGWLALETACRLQDAGNPASTLAIVDSEVPGDRELATATTTAVVMKLATIYEQMLGKPLGLDEDGLNRLSRASQIRLLHSRLIRSGMLPPRSSVEAFKSVFRVFEANITLRYVPARQYLGPTLIITTELDTDHERRTLLNSWRRYAPSAVLREVGGNHMTMLQRPHVDAIVVAVSEHIAVHG